MTNYKQQNFNNTHFEDLTDTVFEMCNINECTFTNLKTVTFLKSNLSKCDFSNTEVYDNVTADHSNIINSVDLDATKITNICSNISNQEDIPNIENEPEFEVVDEAEN